MEIAITSGKSIKEVKKEFSEAFPYLRIEFFQKPHGSGEGSPLTELVNEDTPLLAVTGNTLRGRMVIHAGETVHAVESRFQHYFALPVQIFRKQNDVWLETIKTDHLTLSQQNEMGRNSSSRLPFELPEDFHTWEN